MKISKSLRVLLLFELLLPVVLLLTGVYEGLMQTMFRAGWAYNDPVIMGGDYYKMLTYHGVVNAIVFTTFFAVAFGNGIIEYALKKAINTKIAWLSGILMTGGTVMAAAAILSGKASVLYTFYPPLVASPWFYIGATLLVVGSWIAFFNWIPPYLEWRREHPDEKMPLSVLGTFTTFIVWLMATIPVAYEILGMLLPWSLGWTSGVNVMLARTLFWFFGHPLVYFWILPAYVMYYTMMPKIAGGKLYSDLAGRVTFVMFILFSTPVGLHHQYMDPGIPSIWKYLHGVFTFIIALPSLITAFTLAASLEYAGRKRGAKGLLSWMGKLPWFDRESWLFPYFICGLILFIFGGLTGIMNASYMMNIAVHNTAFLPGHFHMTVAGPVALAFLAMTLYMSGKLLGRKIRLKSFAVAAPYFWTVGMFLFSYGLMIGGVHGMPRRTDLGMSYLNPGSPLFQSDWVTYAHLTAIGGSIMFIGFITYFISLVTTIFSKAQVPVTSAVLEFPVSEAYLDEPVRALNKFKPWIIAGVLLIILAWGPTLWYVGTYYHYKSPPFTPDNAMPIGK